MKVSNTDEVRAAIAAIDKKFMEDVNRGNAAAGAAAYTGDTTIVRGTYSSSFTVPGTDAPMEDRGKTLNVWKRQADGSWKLHRDIWNSNMPIPGSSQTGEEEK